MQRRTWMLIGPDGRPYESDAPGTLGGHRRSRIYGRLDCPGALRAIARGGYVKNRVFFLNEETAIGAGYRPCAVCLPDAYRRWKARTDVTTTQLDASTQRLIKLIDSRWQEFRDAFAGLDADELLEPGVCGEWSTRDLIGHITVWEDEALKHVPEVIAGGRPPSYANTYGGIDAFNALTTEERKHLSLEEVLAEFAETHRRLVAFVESAPPGTFDSKSRARKRLRLDTYGHYPEHTAQILAWRVARSSNAIAP